MLTPSDEPITAQLLNGQPSRPGRRSCMPSRKRSLSTVALSPRQDAKRVKTVVKGEKRIKTITLEDNINIKIRPFKRPSLLGLSTGDRVRGSSSSAWC